MYTQTIPDFTFSNGVTAVGIAIAYIALSSLIKEPNRQKLSAVVVAGAGAAYLSGGLGQWEFVFCTVMTFMAYKGLTHYSFIGIAWLMHTSWDLAHHFYANPIVPFSPSSSAGCAIADAILALWFFFKAPSIFHVFRKSKTAVTG